MDCLHQAKIRAVVPIYDKASIPLFFAESVDKCQKYFGDRWHTLLVSETPYIDLKREIPIDNEKKHDDWTHYLALDSDIKFEPQDVEKLIADDLDIVGGLYPGRKEQTKGNYICGFWDGIQGHTTQEKWIKTDTKFKTPKVKVDWCGTGFLLIKRRVFETMKRPAFGRRLIGKRYIGEDLTFCLQAQEAGYIIYVDTDVILNHLSGDRNMQINPLAVIDGMIERSSKALAEVSALQQQLLQAKTIIQQQLPALQKAAAQPQPEKQSDNKKK